MLPNDVSRCAGYRAGGLNCEIRDTCRRYLEGQLWGPTAWWLSPPPEGPCLAHLLTTEPRGAEERGGKGE
jgi:hypothetical protein